MESSNFFEGQCPNLAVASLQPFKLLDVKLLLLDHPGQYELKQSPKFTEKIGSGEII